MTIVDAHVLGCETRLYLRCIAFLGILCRDISV